jgi:hypothetical protein
MSDISATLAAGQQLAESLMVDEGKAERDTGDTAQNTTTGTIDNVYTTLFSDTPCKIQTRNVVSQASEAGGRTVITQRLELHLPVGSANLKYGDLWTITAAGSGSRTRVGRKVKILGPADKTYQTAMRYEVEEMLT